MAMSRYTVVVPLLGFKGVIDAQALRASSGHALAKILEKIVERAAAANRYLAAFDNVAPLVQGWGLFANHIVIQLQLERARLTVAPEAFLEPYRLAIADINYRDLAMCRFVCRNGEDIGAQLVVANEQEAQARVALVNRGNGIMRDAVRFIHIGTGNRLPVVVTQLVGSYVDVNDYLNPEFVSDEKDAVAMARLFFQPVQEAFRGVHSRHTPLTSPELKDAVATVDDIARSAMIQRDLYIAYRLLTQMVDSVSVTLSEVPPSARQARFIGSRPAAPYLVAELHFSLRENFNAFFDGLPPGFKIRLITEILGQATRLLPVMLPIIQAYMLGDNESAQHASVKQLKHH